MIPIPNVHHRAVEWLEHETRDAAFVLGLGGILVASLLAAPPSWIVGSLWLRFAMGMLMGEWIVRLYRWSQRVRQSRQDRAENEALRRMILRSHDLADLRLRFATLLAERSSPPTKPRRSP